MVSCLFEDRFVAFNEIVDELGDLFLSYLRILLDGIDQEYSLLASGRFDPDAPVHPDRDLERRNVRAERA